MIDRTGGDATTGRSGDDATADGSGGDATLVLAAGCTRTAAIDGISAAGADPDALRWTPTADAEVLVAGEPVRAPALPRSPAGCPTPAVVTRAARERLGFDVAVVDAGLTERAGVAVRDAGADPGEDVRDPVAVPDTESMFEEGRSIGRSIDADHLLLAETIPGGTTTAMGVLATLGERTAVSSSLRDNPRERKRTIVETGLAESGIEPGSLAGRPVAAIRAMGDPVLAALAGVAAGTNADRITLAGGTQLACVGALLRHGGVDRPLDLATTSYVAADDAADVEGLADDLDLDLVVTDPGFGALDGSGLDRFAAGEAKEGVGMGGALALARERGVPTAGLRRDAVDVCERCLAEAR